jgi:hypothetical protein
MKIIQQYRADDGKTFTTPEECERYEAVLKQVCSLLDTLPDADKYNISNGGGYIQHKPGTYKKIETLLIKLSNLWFKPKEKFTHFNYYLGRVIDDSNMSCLNKLSYKLMCIKEEREYGQPYYALHPNECKNIQVN